MKTLFFAVSIIFLSSNIFSSNYLTKTTTYYNHKANIDSTVYWNNEEGNDTLSLSYLDSQTIGTTRSTYSDGKLISQSTYYCDSSSLEFNLNGPYVKTDMLYPSFDSFYCLITRDTGKSSYSRKDSFDLSGKIVKRKLYYNDTYSSFLSYFYSETLTVITDIVKDSLRNRTDSLFYNPVSHKITRHVYDFYGSGGPSSFKIDSLFYYDTQHKLTWIREIQNNNLSISKYLIRSYFEGGYTDSIYLSNDELDRFTVYEFETTPPQAITKTPASKLFSPLSISPNPLNSASMVSINAYSIVSSIQIFNSQGKLMKSFSKPSFYLKDLPNSFYIIRIQQLGKSTQTIKLTICK